MRSSKQFSITYSFSGLLLSSLETSKSVTLTQIIESMIETMATPASVTIGIEIEFMIAQHYNKTTQSKKREDRWACDPPTPDPVTDILKNEPIPWADTVCILKTCETIAERGYPVGCFFPENAHPQNAIVKDAPANSIIQAQGSRRLRVWNKRTGLFQTGTSSRFDYWCIVREGHISTDLMFKPIRTTPRGYKWVPLEINTPIFTGPLELEQGLPQLRNILTLLREKLVIWQNHKCGFHIHVGNGGRELELDTVKRVVSLVYLLEQPLLSNLYHPSRHTHQNVTMISTGSQLVKEANPPLADLTEEGATIMAELGDLKARLKSRVRTCDPIHAILHRIWAIPNIATMRRKLRKYSQDGGSSPRGALYPSEYNTIEFRYPEASFDLEFIHRWASLVRHIFGLALRSRAAFGEMLCMIFEMVTRKQGETVSWPALSAAIGFTAVHPDKWKARVKAYARELYDLDDQGILPRVEAGVALSTSMG